MLAVADSTQNDGLDAGPHHGPGTERFCVVTRAVKPVEEMIRFVVGPDGVVPDVKRKLPGRGLWVTADRKTLQDAVARKAFARGFKREVTVPPDLADLTERLLAQAALDALAIAGKAGLAPAGFAKVEAAVMRDRVVGLLHASEAAPDGVKKLTAVLKSRPDADRIAVIRAFSSAQLDLALGRANVVHAALLAGPPSDTFLARFQRLDRFRTGGSGESGTGRTPN
jgi:predicted RNA-binding protein YlxR (DUF448 family)